MSSVVTLGELVTAAKVERAGDLDLPVLSMTRSGGLVPQESVFNKKVASRDLSKYRVVRPSQLVVGIHIDEGALGVAGDDQMGIVSPAYTLWDLPDSDLLDPDYLHRYIRSPRAISYFIANYRQTAERRGKIPRDRFLALQIPLPPLAEQKRIAGILDAADALRAKRRESLAQLDNLLQSTFLDIFGDPVINPMGWESVSADDSSFGRVEDLATVADVIDCKHRTPMYTDEGYPVVRPRDVREDGISLGDCVKTTAEEIADLTEKRLPSRGDIVYSRNATFGVASLVATSEAFAIGQDVCLIVPRNVNSVFLYYLLNSHFVRRQLGLATSGSTFKRINLRAIRKLKILVPPKPLQEKFEFVFIKQRRLRDQLRRSESELHTLFASLQSRAFRGDL